MKSHAAHAAAAAAAAAGDSCPVVDVLPPRLLDAVACVLTPCHRSRAYERAAIVSAR